MTNELVLYGTVGASWWYEEYFTAKWVRDQLKGMTGDITVRINSGGGIASEGQAIYTLLVDYPGRVTVVVDSVAASAASLIAMAGDEIMIRRGAWMLIHDPATPWTLGRGTEEDHRKEAELLGVIANAYADIYAFTADMSREEARGIMKVETFMDGPMAVEMGFATAIEEAEAVPVATFDYRIYAHAPAAVRRACKTLGPAPEKMAVMAMIAGRPRTNLNPQGVAAMADKTTKAVVTTASEDDPAKTPAAPVAPVVADDATAGDAQTATAVAAATANATARARRITDAVAAARLPATMAGELIGEANLTVEMALDRITAAWKKEGDVDTPMHGRSVATITRDEVDTRRTGMTGALLAQMRRKEPEAGSPAVDFMGYGLVDMAAACIDHRGPIRTAADKIDIFMSAMHTRSDFPGIFENALNKSLLEQYEIQQPSYREISRRRDFNDFRAHPMVRPGDMPRLQPIGESGEIKFGTFGEKRETAILKPMGVGLNLSRQMFIDDDMMAIDQVIMDYATGVTADEDELFYAFMLTAVLASDGLAVWLNAATRGANLAAAGTAISVASLAAGRAVMQKQVGIETANGKADGRKLNIQPAILLVGPDKLTEAEQIVAQIQPQQAGNVNPFAGRLRVVSTAHITGNTWFLFADPARSGGACFVHGFLSGAAAPRLRTEEKFGTQGMGLTVEHDFGLGAVDFRGTYRNPGA